MNRIGKILITTFLILILIASCKKKTYISNPGYSIGTIFYYVPGAIHQNSAINYSFNVDNVSYDNFYSSVSRDKYVPSGENYKKGDMFMVQYQIGKIETSRMLFH